MDDLTIYLQRFGLSLYQSKLIATLIKRESLTAKELADNSEVPHTKIYSALESLIEMGLIKSTLERPKTYTIIDSKTIFETLISKQEEKTKELKAEAKKIESIIKSASKQAKNIETVGRVYYLGTSQAVWKEVAGIANRAKKTLLAMSDQRGWVEAYSYDEVILAWIHASNNRGVKSENVCPQGLDMQQVVKRSLSTTTPEEYVKYLQKLKVSFVDPRKINHTVIVRDNEEVFLAFHASDHKVSSGLIINDKSLARGMTEYFRNMQATGESFDTKAAVQQLKIMVER